ncbi:NAD(P)H-dependent FMN reductase [Psychromicrobium silvestre]|uniref:NAD(P)H-dependent FMN reductase n=1 Tax=Psychromicrobium silvestre TaxID=1645614 RepID=A0A7Y9S8A2_9MICC|nr:NADPH-dependent FMN reductase [Psychromicrobium silvestre]NYE95766.1 NAD(P)H-dependent FMN reductase [Psychromicrobium silvestre]
MTENTVLALVGSLRNGSTNKQLAEAAAQLAPTGTTIVIHEGLADIPFYNEDVDLPDAAPVEAQRLREAAENADAVLFFTPEYNGTIPAVLKNAIDWLSRPFGDGAIKGKPTAVVGTAYGQYGGVWAHDDARKSLKIAGANVVEEAKLSVPGSLVRFAEVHPKDDAEVSGQLSEILQTLLGAVNDKVAA